MLGFQQVKLVFFLKTRFFHIKVNFGDVKGTRNNPRSEKIRIDRDRWQESISYRNRSKRDIHVNRKKDVVLNRNFA